MVVLDEDFSAGLTLVEGDGGARSFPVVVAERTPREWRSLYEREHARAEEERARADAAQARCDARAEEERARADAAQARCEELLWEALEAEVEASRSRCRFVEVAVQSTIRSLRTELGELRRRKQIVQLNKRLDQEKERSESLSEAVEETKEARRRGM